MQRPPVLVFAQSGRFIAQSAARAGFPVRVADCFIDSDTQAVADKTFQLPPLSYLTEAKLLQALTSLSDNKPCLLVCGTGLEGFYSVLSALPSHIDFIGNSTETLSLLREPQPFFDLLDRLKLPYPPTSLTKAPSDRPLRKRLDKAGGSGIIANGDTLQEGEFYQQKIEGETYSVCFVTNQQTVSVMGWNRQVNQADKFLLQQIWQSDKPPAHAAKLTMMLNKLVKASGLRGFNSLDYIVTAEGDIFILEINPRISASVELLFEPDWFNWHIDTCRGRTIPDNTKLNVRKPLRLLHYCFAETNLKVTDSPDWPSQCHDLPAAGSPIKKGQPICTVVVAAETEQACKEQLKSCQQIMLKNCLKLA